MTSKSNDVVLADDTIEDFDDDERDASSKDYSSWLIFLAVAVPTLMITYVAFGFYDTLNAVPWHFPSILLDNTPTGGDMGAHVLLPQILRDNLLPQGRLLGWSGAWFSGFPVLFFYFPLPALSTVILDLVLPYGVAFKLVAMSGLIALPTALYFLIKYSGFKRSVAVVAAYAGAMFVFMESYSIFGGNFKSVLAGEFSFSWSFTLSIAYLAILMRDVRREQTRWSPLAAILLALAAMSHVVPVMIIVAASLSLLFRKNGPKILFLSWIVGFSLAAIWALPFISGFYSGLTTDMGWDAVRNIVGNDQPGSVVPTELVVVLLAAIPGVIWTVLRRDDVSVLLTLLFMPVVGYFLLPKLGITFLYNARLLPFWYLALFIFAGLAFGLLFTAVARNLWGTRLAVSIAVIVAVIPILGYGVSMINDVPFWVTWNFSGYESKAGYPEYAELMTKMDELPPGRVLWEANNDMNKYGTPMALMLFPYWTPEHPSSEGLFFESSISTPFHFLTTSEVSFKPSNPVRGLEYHSMDFDRALPHMELYDIEYYVSYTPEGFNAATAAGLVVLDSAPPWTIFSTDIERTAAPYEDLVVPAKFMPSVYIGDLSFTDASLVFFDDVTKLDRPLVETGLPQWPQVDSVNARPEITIELLETSFSNGNDVAGNGVSNIVYGNDGAAISFHTIHVGVPHIVKMSYFPNWAVSGAQGPFRASPSTMIVVPTQEDVVLTFARSSMEYLGAAISFVTLLFLIGLAVTRRFAVKNAELDPAITIPPTPDPNPTSLQQ